MSRVEACLICGDSSRTVFELVRWADPDPGEAFNAMPRCADRAACRTRVEANGEEWPLAELDVSEPRQRHFSDGHRQVFEATRKWRERQSA